MIAFFAAIARTIAIVVSFVLFIALWLAAFGAVYGAGLLASGMTMEEMQALVPDGPAMPSPYFVGGAIGGLVALVMAMIAMLISERTHRVGGFVSACLRAQIVLSAIFVLPIAGLALAAENAARADRILPPALFFGGSLVAVIVTAVLLALPFLWWVSERPRKRRAEAAAPSGHESAAALVPSAAGVVAGHGQTPPEPVPSAFAPSASPSHAPRPVSPA